MFSHVPGFLFFSYFFKFLLSLSKSLDTVLITLLIFSNISPKSLERETFLQSMCPLFIIINIIVIRPTAKNQIVCALQGGGFLCKEKFKNEIDPSKNQCLRVFITAKELKQHQTEQAMHGYLRHHNPKHDFPNLVAVK